MAPTVGSLRHLDVVAHGAVLPGEEPDLMAAVGLGKSGIDRPTHQTDFIVVHEDDQPRSPGVVRGTGIVTACDLSDRFPGRQSVRAALSRHTCSRHCRT
jgi:hypothetical protein